MLAHLLDGCGRLSAEPTDEVRRHRVAHALDVHREHRQARPARRVEQVRVRRLERHEVARERHERVDGSTRRLTEPEQLGRRHAEWATRVARRALAHDERLGALDEASRRRCKVAREAQLAEVARVGESRRESARAGDEMSARS